MMLLALVEFCSGLAAGYAICSATESLLHEYVSDAPPSVTAKWRKRPRLFRVLLRTQFSHHVVHHYLTFRENHVTQFASEKERERLTALLLARGRHGHVIVRGDFANRLHAEGAFVFSLPVLLFALAFGVILPTAFAAGSALTLSLAPVFSYLVHPYLHMRRSEAMRRAPLPVRLFLRTGYAQAMYRNHYLHHRYGGTSNFNLVLGFDALRGRMRRPSQADMDEMNRLGLCRIG